MYIYFVKKIKNKKKLRIKKREKKSTVIIILFTSFIYALFEGWRNKEIKVKKKNLKMELKKKIFNAHIGEVGNNTLSFSRSVSNQCLRYEPKLTFYPTLALA